MSKKDDFQQLSKENERLRESIGDLQVLNELATIISSTLKLNRILDKVVSFSVKAVSAEQGQISLLTRSESGDPFTTYIRKRDDSTVTEKYRLDEDLSGWMMKWRKSLVINDFAKDDRFKGEHSTVKEIRSILSVPLLCKGKLIGVLNLFNKKYGGLFSEDDKRLLNIMATQSAQVIENARLYEEEKNLRQMEQDLQTAHEIQQRLLPKENPAIAGFDVAGISYPAKKVGGDYFDFIELETKRWVIALGDISGKGVAAALLMANLQATLRNQAISMPTLLDGICKTNHFLYRNTEPDKFVTLLCGILDPFDKKFTYVNCGHNFPFHLNREGKFTELDKGGIVLGMFPDSTFEKDRVQVEPGDIIFIYSDGITEAENEFEEMFGEERLKTIILKNRRLGAKDLVDKVFKEVTTFSGNEQDDDITMIALKAL
ncbi:MAG: PP2C family protein-serine/threonine phosphatase [bacterium]